MPCRLFVTRLLRELALEGVHGKRADGSRLGAPASGRALELMNQGLVWLADNLRVSYGEGGVLPLCRMMLRAASVYPVLVGGRVLEGLDAGAALRLVWPPWYPASSEDRARDAATLMALVEGALLPAGKVQRWLDAEWGVADGGDAGGEDWRYWLTYWAGYARANGRVGGGGGVGTGRSPTVVVRA